MLVWGYSLVVIVSLDFLVLFLVLKTADVALVIGTCFSRLTRRENCRNTTDATCRLLPGLARVSDEPR